MDILNNSQISDLLNARNNLRSAKETLWDSCCKLFMPGTVIYWRTSNNMYKQQGRVICVIGTGTNPRIRSLNEKTGREVDVDFFSIDWHAMRSQADSYEGLKAEVL